MQLIVKIASFANYQKIIFLPGDASFFTKAAGPALPLDIHAVVTPFNICHPLRGVNFHRNQFAHFPL